MKNEFYIKLKANKIRAIAELIVAILVVCFPVMTVGYWSNLFARYLFLSLSLVTILVMCCFVLYDRKLKHLTEPWQFKAKKIPARRVIEIFDANEIIENNYYTFLKYNRTTARCLIQLSSEFDTKQASNDRKKANQRLNKKYGIKQDISIYEAHNLMRINLVVCENKTSELIEWVQNTDRLMYRAECIINAAYLPNDGILLFPAIQKNTTNGIKLYQTAMEILMYRLGNNCL